MRFLCGDDERLYEEFMEGPSGAEGKLFYTNPNDPGIGPLRGNSSRFPISTSVKMFRVEVTVNRGLANFQLHAILSYGGNLAPAGKVIRPPSKKGPNLGYPFKVLSIRETKIWSTEQAVSAYF